MPYCNTPLNYCAGSIALFFWYETFQGLLDRALLFFAVVGYISLLPIVFRVALLTLGQLYDCPDANEGVPSNLVGRENYIPTNPRLPGLHNIIF